MKLKDAIKLAINTSYIDDQLEIEALRKGLDIVKEECPFIEFLDTPTGEIPFKSDTVLVTTKVEGREANKIRQLKRGDGRNSFTVPSLRLEAPIDGFLRPYFRTEQGISDMADRTALFFGSSYTGLLRQYILQGLLYTAEMQGNVVRATPDTLKREVNRAVGAIDDSSSIITNAKYAASVSDRPFERSVGIDGKVRLFYELDADVLIVVPDKPEDVGFVRTDLLPEMFVTVQNPGSIRASAVFEAGFCFWGGVPITKIVVEKG